jgi:hypothetical protein
VSVTQIHYGGLDGRSAILNGVRCRLFQNRRILRAFTCKKPTSAQAAARGWTSERRTVNECVTRGQW